MAKATDDAGATSPRQGVHLSRGHDGAGAEPTEAPLDSVLDPEADARGDHGYTETPTTGIYASEDGTGAPVNLSEG